MKKKVPLHIRNSVEYAPYNETTRLGCIVGMILMCISAVIVAAGAWQLLDWALDFWR